MEVEILLEVFRMRNKYVAAAALSLLMMNPFNAGAAGKNGVAAVVNGEKITVAEMKQGYEDNRQIKEKVSFDDFYEKALEIYVNGKLLYQAAVAADVLETPEYKRAVDQAKEEIARKVYLEQKVDKKVTDKAVKDLYNKYKSEFKSQKEIHAKHILVEDEGTAKKVIAELGKGKKFDDLAKQYSKDNAVDLGYFVKDQMVPEFGNAAFAMKKGQTSKSPVKTKFGYHGIEVLDIRDSKPLPLKQVEPELKAMLTQQAIAEVFTSLNKGAKIERFDLDGKPITDPVVQLQ